MEELMEDNAQIKEMRENLKKLVDCLPPEEVKKMWERVEVFAKIFFMAIEGEPGKCHN